MTASVTASEPEVLSSLAVVTAPPAILVASTALFCNSSVLIALLPMSACPIAPEPPPPPLNVVAIVSDGLLPSRAAFKLPVTAPVNDIPTACAKRVAVFALPAN